VAGHMTAARRGAFAIRSRKCQQGNTGVLRLHPTGVSELPPDVVGSHDFVPLSRIRLPGPGAVGPRGDTIDVATGLASLAKTPRVRRHPKVGLLLEGNGEPDQPGVSVAGIGAGRDADIQATWIRLNLPLAIFPTNHRARRAGRSGVPTRHGRTTAWQISRRTPDD
jgi:hypothetical protein